jgi:undecaprenyl-diphosphatase
LSILEAIILAIIEGVTEFLPVSSTGHMIIGSSVMGIAHEEFTKIFTVSIQLGAIMSVILLYWKRFFQTFDFYLKLFVAFLPAAVIGFLFNDVIDAMLENVIVVAVSLLAGGVVLLFVDKWFSHTEQNARNEVTYSKALKVGLFQLISMMPGVSRSAATIIGGLAQGMNRRTAAEFSFFLAVPTMFAATFHSLFLKDMVISGSKIKGYELILKSTDNISAFAVGNVVAFIVALLAIKTFIAFLTRHGFKVFGYYRIVVGLAILILYFSGVELSIV